jgi:hypothetical protein
MHDRVNGTGVMACRRFRYKRRLSQWFPRIAGLHGATQASCLIPPKTQSPSLPFYRTRLKTGAMERKTIAFCFGAPSFSPYRPMAILRARSPSPPRRHGVMPNLVPTGIGIPRTNSPALIRRLPSNCTSSNNTLPDAVPTINPRFVLPSTCPGEPVLRCIGKTLCSLSRRGGSLGNETNV